MKKDKIKLPARYWIFAGIVLGALLLLSIILAAIGSVLMLWSFIVFGLFLIGFLGEGLQLLLIQKLKEKTVWNFYLPVCIFEIFKIIPYIILMVAFYFLAGAGEMPLKWIFSIAIGIVALFMVYIFIRDCIHYCKILKGNKGKQQTS